MRVAHFTDLHLSRRPGLADLLGKRLLGAGNLYVAGRGRRFSEEVVEALVEAVLSLDPDLCVCTGDLTALALADEFAAVRERLEPLLASRPCVLVPGNHDAYTRAAHRERTFQGIFGRWCGGGAFPFVHREGEVAFVGLDCSDPHPLLATGAVGERQIAALDALLAEESRHGSTVVLLLHYPLRDHAGRPYAHRGRRLLDAGQVERVVTDRVAMILHGHEHRGFRTALPSGIPVLNPGAGGRACSPARGETAHFNVVEVTPGRPPRVDRWAFDGGRFAPEPGGSYASGR
jgi:3',5'-cyclic AMP phosphodiesterase CpdA